MKKRLWFLTGEERFALKKTRSIRSLSLQTSAAFVTSV
jgi:hypothetical protein